ncbi:MAG: efflux RND transporter periplasmic adaptor subunit [Pyrinomonadaceae bacterium]|nr:efflux RND transporter periplasmic adaptor subunit [Pyrinomonadaceae bacterium]
MKRRIIYTTIAIIVVAAVAALLLRATDTKSIEDPSSNAQAAKAASSGSVTAKDVIAAPGRVEPVSEEIEVGAEISGKIKEVFVEEGDKVVRQQILAVLENSDYQAQLSFVQSQQGAAEAQLASAEARLEQARAELRRTLNGARGEERREARAAVEQADATIRNAQLELDRRRALHREGVISTEELNRAERDLRVNLARGKELRERFAFINADAREEDVARSEASVGLAQAQISEARARIGEVKAQIRETQARLDKTFIRSPITGIVLRKRLKAGESVSLESPEPSVFTLADTSVLRVRVDVDETDVGKLQIGQAAYVTADAYGDKRFAGRVVSIGQVLGKKNIRTEEPTERVDTKILETLVELDANQRLPPGLRVDTFINVSHSTLDRNSDETSHVSSRSLPKNRQQIMRRTRS